MEAVRKRQSLHDIAEQLHAHMREVRPTDAPPGRELYDALPGLVIVISPHGKLLHASQHIQRYACIESGWAHILHPDDVAPTLAAWNHALQTGEPYARCPRYLMRDGTYRHMMVRVVPQRDAQGRITEWIGTHMDVTDLLAHKSAAAA